MKILKAWHVISCIAVYEYSTFESTSYTKKILIRDKTEKILWVR